MATLDLRPLSLGELLDRTFTLYRGHFLLFIGISAVPHVLVLLMQLVQTMVSPAYALFSNPFHPNLPGQFPDISWKGVAYTILFSLAVLIVNFLASMLSQGATVIAVSELYLGRTITLADAFRRIWKNFFTILVVAVLIFLAAFGGALLLIIPGIYIFCRLAASVQAAVLEDIGPVEALSRSFTLSADNAGRVFLIYVLYYCLMDGAAALLGGPFIVGTLLTKNPDMVRVFTMLTAVGSFIAGTLVIPIVTIAMSLFYYDMRVRKEGFDLQVMMSTVGGAAPAAGGPPSMLSTDLS
jgi:hypothetical protein